MRTYDPTKPLNAQLQALSQEIGGTSLASALQLREREANAAGWGFLRCETHRRYLCPLCACPRCGLAHECSCSSRETKSPHSGPPLPRKRTNTRRLGVEAEVYTRRWSDLQRVLRAWPWAHDDGSLDCTRGVELKFCGYADEKFTGLAAPIRRVLSLPEIVSHSACGLHVHVERDGIDKDSIRDRWLEMQDHMFSLFPSRCGSQWCYAIQEDEYDHYHALDGHYKVVSWSGNHNTVEVRIHPGSSSWIVTLAWADWCHRFVARRLQNDAIGVRYLAAREAQREAARAAGITRPSCFPHVWVKAIERYAANRTTGEVLAEIRDGRFFGAERSESLPGYAEREGIMFRTRRSR